MNKYTIMTILLTITVLCMVLCTIAPIGTKLFAGIAFITGSTTIKMIDNLEKNVVVEMES